LPSAVSAKGSGRFGRSRPFDFSSALPAGDASREPLTLSAGPNSPPAQGSQSLPVGAIAGIIAALFFAAVGAAVGLVIYRRRSPMAPASSELSGSPVGCTDPTVQALATASLYSTNVTFDSDWQMEQARTIESTVGDVFKDSPHEQPAPIDSLLRAFM
jgi:hypothetical protein